MKKEEEKNIDRKMNKEMNKDKKHKSNRALVIACICSVTFMALVTIGSMSYFKAQVEKSIGAQDESEYENYNKYYVMISSDNESSFWKAVYEGARKFGKEQGIYVEMLGNHFSTGYSKAELMKIAIAAGADGIILEADQSLKLEMLINEAEEKGIPVVTVLKDNSHSARKSFVGISSYNIGREYGKQVIEAAHEKEVNTVFVLMNSNSDDTNQNILFSGIQDVLNEELSEEEMNIQIQTEAISSKGIFSVEESIRDIFMDKEKLPDVIICLDEQSTTCAYQAVVDYNKVGLIDIIGYYDSETILKGIERNVIRSTISINTEEMGKFSVEALAEFENTGHVSEYFTVDTNLVTSSNVKEFLGGADDAFK